MTHTPPVPAGNQSPYPLQEPPHTHADTPPAGAAVVRTPARASDGPNPWVIGGLLAGGVAAVAAVGAWLYATEPKYKRKERRRRRKSR